MDRQHGNRDYSQTSLADAEPDLYALLGISEGAPAEQVKRGYRAAMKRIHPDRVNPEQRQAAEDEAKRVNSAFRTLSNPTLKRQYDAKRKAEAVQDQIMGRYFGGFGAPGSRNDLYDQIMQVARAEQRKQQKRHDRNATASLLTVFSALLVVAIIAILLWGVLSSIAGNLF